jgi:hypothetical protein
MKAPIAFTVMFLAAGSTLALAQGSGSGGGAAGGASAGGASSGVGPAPGSQPSGTGSTGSINSGGIGVPGGTGPGDTTSRPNQPAMNPSNPAAGVGTGASNIQPGLRGSGRLVTRPSNLDTRVPSAQEIESAASPVDADGFPTSTPRIMAPERR